MKTIKFMTNLDNYQSNIFPDNLDYVPRKGEMVMVVNGLHEYYLNKKLPTRLEVVNVIHTENAVVCELWYNETDKKIARLNGAKI